MHESIRRSGSSQKFVKLLNQILKKLTRNKHTHIQFNIITFSPYGGNEDFCKDIKLIKISV